MLYRTPKRTDEIRKVGLDWIKRNKTLVQEINQILRIQIIRRRQQGDSDDKVVEEQRWAERMKGTKAPLWIIIFFLHLL